MNGSDDATPRAALRLVRPYALPIAASACLGAIGGLSVAGLLATINSGLHAGSDEGKSLFLSFAALCALVLVGSVGSDIATNFVGQKVIASLRKSLADKILTAPIEEIIGFKPYRLIPVLTHDVDTISDFAFFLSSFAVSLVVTCGCLAYLAWLSPPMFAVVAVMVSIGVVAQGYAQTRGIKGFVAAREGEDRLQKQYRAIAEGAKELRINRPRRVRIATDLHDTVDWICRRQLSAIILFVTARAFGMGLFFAVIALTILLRQVVWHDINSTAASGFVLVLLYMRGPVDQVIGTLPAMGRCLVAFRRVADLSTRFEAVEPTLLATLAAQSTIAHPPFASAIELRGASYAFPTSEGGTPFVLGPINLTIEKGQILFVVGANGSGKTTLAKLLLGLYPPSAGAILLDGTPVKLKETDAYRQLFTTILSDYYLFDDIVARDAQIPAEAGLYLERLELSHKVTIEDGAFSTLDLSTGQRKRLALLNAWLEDRPILVFDEWAADQDPAFREIFYADLLPDLKRAGKTIIVISHDDRYFTFADRVVRLKDGKIHETHASAA